MHKFVVDFWGKLIYMIVLLNIWFDSDFFFFFKHWFIIVHKKRRRKEYRKVPWGAHTYRAVNCCNLELCLQGQLCITNNSAAFKDGPDTCIKWDVRLSFSEFLRFIRNLRRQDSVSLVMMELLWLPLHHRITFKLCTLMHGIHHGHCPKYMKEMVVLVSTLPGRERLWSATTLNYDICRTKLKFGERVFAVAAPKAWNFLPDFLKPTMLLNSGKTWKTI